VFARPKKRIISYFYKIVLVNASNNVGIFPSPMEIVIIPCYNNYKLQQFLEK
jgi:hypothetical protein